MAKQSKISLPLTKGEYARLRREATQRKITVGELIRKEYMAGRENITRLGRVTDAFTELFYVHAKMTTSLWRIKRVTGKPLEEAEKLADASLKLMTQIDKAIRPKMEAHPRAHIYSFRVTTEEARIMDMDAECHDMQRATVIRTTVLRHLYDNKSSVKLATVEQAVADLKQSECLLSSIACQAIMHHAIDNDQEGTIKTIFQTELGTLAQLQAPGA